MPRTASTMRRRRTGGGATGSIESATMLSSSSISSWFRTAVMSLSLRTLHAQCRHSFADHTTQFRFSHSVASGQIAKSQPAEEELLDQACRDHSLVTYDARGGLALSPGQSRFPGEPHKD